MRFSNVCFSPLQIYKQTGVTLRPMCLTYCVCAPVPFALRTINQWKQHRAILYLVLLWRRDVVAVRIAQAGHDHLRDGRPIQPRHVVSNGVPQSAACHRGELPWNTGYGDAAYKRQLRRNNSRLPLEWELHLVTKWDHMFIHPCLALMHCVLSVMRVAGSGLHCRLYSKDVGVFFVAVGSQTGRTCRNGHRGVSRTHTWFPTQQRFQSTGLFISPSGISELDCATTKTDTAERSISIGRESLRTASVV